MYKKILVALDNSEADETLIPHVAQLAKILHSELLLVHVANGWVARRYDDFMLRESTEMVEDKAYLLQVAQQLEGQGIKVGIHLALGDPPEEILKVADQQQCDLLALTSHGHRFLADFLLGSTIDSVRHQTTIPMLVVRMGGQPL